ncbi:hypothetical protein C9374_005510 [Naegleria lovaniensis]|uniref:Uncharacterized protein n=1 Tax=Naegleria lovaniensis TaxID=51637 RepID=A0AA88KJW9_NAELO|nr:uncharacterized protein C9374_005510 [Naegleria lovaniensis]KAG2382308.1 hypothetical protein C9374_005510 [Naegleria lovaniensis]
MNQRRILLALLQNKKVSSHSSLLTTTIQKRFVSSGSDRSPLETAPGHVKRTTVDLSRKQPEYELPYDGPQQYNINTSGFDDTYDVWWDDGAGQKQWAYKDTYPTLSTKDVLLSTIYLVGWALALWAAYRHLFQPTLAMHPATLVALTPGQKEKAKELREKRLEEMEKYGIEQ